MTIYFKTGVKLEISKEIAEIINKKIIEGCKKFQTFSNEKDELILIINVEEIVFIR